MSARNKFHPVHLDPTEHGGMSNENEAELSITKLYFNNSSLDVSIAHRNNVCVTLSKTLQQQYVSGDIIIRTEWVFRGNAVSEKAYKSIVDAIQNYNIRTAETALFAQRLKEFVSARPYSSSNLRIVFDRTIKARMIKESTFIYLHDEDILMCSSEHANRILHPNSPEGVTDASHYDYVTNNGMTGFFVEIVDNDSSIGTRFIFTGKRLLEITPVEDINRRTGVYYHVAQNHPAAGVDIEKSYCSSDEAMENIGLFRTKDEAITGGNPENISKSELESMKLQTARAQYDLETFRTENTMLKEKIEKVKLERDDFFNERKSRRTDTYEERSAARKDSSEVYKIAAAIAGTAVAMYFGMRK